MVFTLPLHVSRPSAAAGSGCTAIRRPACTDVRARSAVQVRAAASNDLGLIKKESHGDGVLFVFGTESEKKAADEQPTPQASEPEPAPAAPAAEAPHAPSAQAAAPPAQQETTPAPSPTPEQAPQSTPPSPVSEAPAPVQPTAKAEAPSEPAAAKEPEATAFVSVAPGSPESNGQSAKTSAAAAAADEPVEIDLASLKVAELKKIAKEKEITGYSRMKKDELVEVISQAVQ